MFYYSTTKKRMTFGNRNLKESKAGFLQCYSHDLQSLPLSPKRAERKGRRRPFRETGSGHKQWNMVSCVDTFSIISMFEIRIIQLTIAFNHSYHTCKFDIDWISILLKISKINANFDIIAACSSSPSLLLLPFASCS